jgi:hypothetical protein
MRINEVICDACGKKIEKPVFGLILMEKDADYASGNGWDNEPKLGELDFCNECKEKIVKVVREFASPEEKEELVELGPDPETDKIFDEEQNIAEEWSKPDQEQKEPERDDGGPLKSFKRFIQKKEEQPEITEEERKRYAKMSIRALLKEGISVDDIVKIKGCCKQSVINVRSSMKKRGEKIPDHRMTIEEKDGAAVEAAGGAAVKKTYNCAEVINTCENASRLGGTVFCDYLDKHGKSRGCKPPACTVYVRKGEK